MKEIEEILEEGEEWWSIIDGLYAWTEFPEDRVELLKGKLNEVIRYVNKK